MNGYYAPYVPGWDTHGLPVEQQLAKKGVDRKTMDRAKYRELCRQFAEEQVQKQMADFKRLGVMADWDHPYITLQPKFEAEEIRVFGEMFKKGYIYKGKKPVYWSWSSESTLAEAEVEYHDIKSPRIYVAFPIKDGKGILDSDTSLVIWTTTPWTIPSNVGITVNPKFDYSVVEVNGKKYVIGSQRLSAVAEDLGWEDYKVVKTLKGTDFDRMTYQHPLYDVTGLVMNDTYVTADDGTGLVHNATGFGEDDYNVGRRYGLPVFSPMDAQGRFTKEVPDPDLVGMFYDDANKVVADKLEKAGALLKLSFFTHSYPHDWRTKKPVIYRATTQWFASIDKFRDQILAEIEKANFIPAWGKTRLYNMIKDRGDWCISRQRSWGVPIPIIYCEDGTPIMEEEVFKHISNLFRKYGSNVWFERDEKDLLPEGYINEHSPNGIFKKEKDIMDVWFDSGSSHTGCMIERGYRYPVDLYFEGSDQYRGWFNSSLIVGTAAHGCAPYKTVLSHGFVLDGKGNKMSKSLGNTVDPIKLVNQYGADIVRLWATSVAYQQDVRISNDIMKQISENYRKIRNTMRFVLGNLNDFKQADLVAVEALADVDKYMLAQLNDLIKGYHKAYDNYDFAEANQLILNYFTNLLSSFYMDFTKDILYIEKADSLRRRQVQTVLYYHAKAMMKLISPVLVFTAEELHDHFHCDDNKADSIFLEPNVEMINMPNSDQLKAHFDRFLELRKDVMKALEGLRNEKIIKSNMEAKVTISLKDEFKEMASMLADLKQLFIVAKVELVKDSSLEEFDSAYIKVEKFEGHQCPRCWNYFDEDEMEGELCPRCHAVING